MTMNFYDSITDFLFCSSLSIKEIADELNAEEKYIHQAIRDLGLDWVYQTRKKNHASRGQSALYDIFRILLPRTKIETEFVIDNNLRLDVYCVDYKLAAEYHGRQHYQYVEHFHKNKKGFHESRQRDQDKIDHCANLGIGLVIFSHMDRLDEDTVYDKLIYQLEHMPEPKVIDESEVHKHNRHYYEQRLKQHREYKRKKYQEAKEKRRQIRGK